MHKTIALLCFFAPGLAAGCGAQPLDASGDGQDLLSDGPKADSAAPALTGIFQLGGTSLDAGDLIYLQLVADGRFAWTRCYDAGCANPIAEDGTFTQTRTRAGKKYLRFWQAGAAGDSVTHLNAIYAYGLSGDHSTLRLRKIYGSRTFRMDAVAEPDLCASSGGHWNDASRACSCGSGWPTAYGPGAGGCWVAPSANESQCDATGGRWTDDDADLIGTFCECGIGRHLTDEGCTANPT